jgi:hypothetical protein
VKSNKKKTNKQFNTKYWLWCRNKIVENDLVIETNLDLFSINSNDHLSLTPQTTSSSKFQFVYQIHTYLHHISTSKTWCVTKLKNEGSSSERNTNISITSTERKTMKTIDNSNLKQSVSKPSIFILLINNTNNTMIVVSFSTNFLVKKKQHLVSQEPQTRKRKNRRNEDFVHQRKSIIESNGTLVSIQTNSQ